MKSWIKDVSLGVAVASLLACAGPVQESVAAGGKATVVAEMGGVSITDQELLALFGALAQNDRTAIAENPKLQEQLVRGELVRRLLVREADREGLRSKPAVALKMEQAAKQVLASEYVASQVTLPPGFPEEARLKEVYEKNKAQFKQPDRYHVAQIYLEFPPNATPEDQKRVKEEITKLRKQVSDDPASFAKVATAKSQHKESAAKGGDMGWMQANQLIPQMAVALREVQPGQVAGVVQAKQGVHLLKLLEREPGATQSFDSVKERLASSIRQGMSRQKEQEFLRDLMSKNQLKLEKLPTFTP